MAQYQVIARKWRPQQFDDVIGQEHITTTLKNAIKNNRIAHAYLFVGPRGTGKTTTARIFAKALNCEKGPTLTPCDECSNCKEIVAGNSMNVLEIDGASNRGIDEIRQLRDTVKYAPAGARLKIYIIDEVHMLTKEAFNALLKTLEEPPAHVKFFFATTEPEKVLSTILSRCQRFDLRRIPAALIVKHLIAIAKSEKVKISEEALFAIARGAEGGMRDAQSALDQLISYCGAEIAEEDVLAMYGLAGSKQILSVVKALLEGNAPSTIALLNEITESGKDLQRLLVDLIGHFRNLLLLKLGMDAADMLDLADAQLKELRDMSASTDSDALLQIVDLLSSAEGRVRWSPAKKIVLEVTLLKAIKARDGVGIDALIKKLNEVKRNLSGHTPVTAPATPRTASAVKPMPKAMEAHEAPVSYPAEGTRSPSAPSADLNTVWQQVLDRVGQVSPFIKSHLVDARPVSFDGRVLIVGYDSEFAGHKDLAATPRTVDLLQTKLKEIMHKDVVVRFDVVADPSLIKPTPSAKSEPVPVASADEPEPEPVAPASTPPLPKKSKSDFKDDPLIKKALEIFRGQIVDVKA
ncbi:MAG: DNA polymerase III subunit gamma/tau [Verrucomicrobiae bacterium]|nr:DNA polymerase III subunit gamma/tau [Verrucomicrobiae bacterium]